VSGSECIGMRLARFEAAPETMNDRKWSYNTSVAEGLLSVPTSASESSVTISCSKRLVSSVPQISGTPVSRSPIVTSPSQDYCRELYQCRDQDASSRLQLQPLRSTLVLPGRGADLFCPINEG